MGLSEFQEDYHLLAECSLCEKRVLEEHMVVLYFETSSLKV